MRLPRLIGVSRMMDLMLTGRTYGAEEGQAFGLSHFLVGDGEGLAKGIEIAKRIADNSPPTNFAVMHVLPRIAEQDRASGYLPKSLIAAIAQGSDEAKTRLKDFLEKRGKKVLRTEAMRERQSSARAAPLRAGAAWRRRRSLVDRRPTARSIFARRSRCRLSGQTDRTAGALGRRPRPIACSWRSARRTARGARSRYAQALEQVRRIGAALLTRGLSAERPIAILSGNDHRARAARSRGDDVGIPYAPISAPYSLISSDFGKLKSIIEICSRPGLVFASRRRAFARAIDAAVPPGVEIVVTANPLGSRPSTPFADLIVTRPTAAVDAAHAEVGPDTIAKFLFTSGSTGNPKGVINTQRMRCANQAMIRAGLAFFADEPPVIVDWPPWNHTFGGNHDFGLVLDNGGSLYIDEGKPLPGAIEATVRT